MSEDNGSVGPFKIVEPLLIPDYNKYTSFLDILRSLKSKKLEIVTGRAFALSCNIANEESRPPKSPSPVKGDPLYLFYQRISGLKDKALYDAVFETEAQEHRLAKSLHDVRQHLADNHWPVHRENFYHLVAASFTSYQHTGQIVTPVFLDKPAAGVREGLIDAFIERL